MNAARSRLLLTMEIPWLFCWKVMIARSLRSMKVDFVWHAKFRNCHCNSATQCLLDLYNSSRDIFLTLLMFNKFWFVHLPPVCTNNYVVLCVYWNWIPPSVGNLYRIYHRIHYWSTWWKKRKKKRGVGPSFHLFLSRVFLSFFCRCVSCSVFCEKLCFLFKKIRI